MEHKDFFKGLSNIYDKYAIGNKLMREFSKRYEENEEENEEDVGIRCGMYYSPFQRLAVYLENKYDITSVKLIQTAHVYELLEYMRFEGFKDATLKSYVTSVRQVYKDNKHLFSDEFVLPTYAAYELYRQEYKI